MSLSQTQIDLITEGFRAGQQSERKRIDALLQSLPAQFSHNDHATRAIAKARQLISQDHAKRTDLATSEDLNSTVFALTHEGQK